MDDQSFRDKIEFAWHVHAAQEAWTAKVDAKASLLLAAQTALLSASVAIAALGGLQRLNDAARGMVGVSSICLTFGIGLAGAAVFPMLGKSDSPSLIYFGGVRHLGKPRYRQALRDAALPSQLSALGDQVFEMSRRNWRKHRLLQFGMGCSGVAVLFAAGASMLGLFFPI